MATAEDVARYILYLSQQEPEPELMSQMRLHKLLYYCQAWNLAMRDEPLFDDVIEAWQHGPVVRSVYPAFADYGSSAIAAHEARPCESLGLNEQCMVESIWSRYKMYSATQLRQMTHEEQPWIDATGGDESSIPVHAVISRESMSAFFRREYDKTARPGMDSTSLLRRRAEFKAGRGTSLHEFVEELT